MVFMLIKFARNTLDVSSGVSTCPAQGALCSIVHHGLATPPRAIQVAGLNLLPAWSLIVSEVASDARHPQWDGTTFPPLI